MLEYKNASDIRKHWSEFLDVAIRENPIFIKRTRDNLALLNMDMIKNILEPIEYIVVLEKEENGDIIITSEVLRLIESGKTEDEAFDLIASGILDYALDYFNDFSYWYSYPDRKAHLPYVLKAILLNDVFEIKKLIRKGD